MIVHYTARQTQLTADLKETCEKRLKVLKKLLSFVIEVNFIFSSTRNRHKAEIHVKAKGGRIVIVEESHDMLHSLNLALDSLEKKVKKERAKFRERKRRMSREKKTLTLSEDTGEREKRIIRSDYFSPKPMTVEEALIQLDIQKKEVYVFRKQDSEKWAVLFCRTDGNYGLVEPE
ncbi:MAG: ribosome-associated translation inhibitor RaiA [Candidatus Aminicenantales bacterium]